MIKLLKLLENNARMPYSEIAARLNISEAEAEARVKELEENGTIVGYHTAIDWDKTDSETVTALIDVKVTPQREMGFDRVARRIYRFEEVESLYLMSGAYDLSVLITGRTMKEVALFVSQKLSTMESVAGTATHFLLKKYKEGGMVYDHEENEGERIQLV
ncbi:MAG: Lrp/AsnC family transcriptional regulator [Oscillospiraceae bacterium]|nr:Lrp/AsnC family transcriptional regulator [Oscillospiraceae bacterium]